MHKSDVRTMMKWGYWVGLCVRWRSTEAGRRRYGCMW